jgi:ABC-type phosphate transport system substrate-binding protein
VPSLKKRTLATAIAAGAIAAAAVAPTANAAFTSPFVPKCSGASITGAGASFQNTLQAGWIAGFGGAGAGIYCDNTQFTNSNTNSRGSFDTDKVDLLASPPIPLKTVAYLGGGSGAGLTSMGANLATNTNPNHLRSATNRFAGTDDPPTATQLAEMNAGPLPDVPGDEGAVRTIPVASGSTTIIMNYPDDCNIPAAFAFKGPDGSYKYPAGTTRVKLTRSRTEFAWAGDANYDTWGELVPGITGKNGKSDADCQNQTVKRVVRLDASGTTFLFKQWLALQRPTRNWREDALPVTYNNQDWPNDSGATAVLRGTGNGNGPLADKVVATDGSIGYGDLAVARSKGFNKQNTDADTTWWLPVQNQANSYKEPTYSPESYKVNRPAGTIDAGDPGFTAKKGSNCRSTTYTNLPGGGDGPEDTLLSWSQVEGVGGTGEYPICGLTYVMAWDDTFDAFGAGVNRIEEARQKTVKDYLFYALSNTGQNLGDINDYARVPDSILVNIARPAQLALDYNK